MIAYNKKFKILLGYTKKAQNGRREPIYLEGFSWECEWYWGGGYIGNKNMHAHFDGAFLETPDIRGHVLGNFITPWTKLPDYIKKENCVVVSNGCSVWEDITTFLDDAPEHIASNWWRIKDLYKQFYALRAAAEVFHLGGHCTPASRNPAEINKDMEKAVNLHIATVIIPEICKVLEVEQ